jgi:branched-chain amino acid transport system ATP-binding protein
MTLLTCAGVQAGFGPNLVLRGVNLEVAAGSCVGLFGLNGAGKSVTMKVIGGLVPARAGSVVLDGEDLVRLSPEERVRRGMVLAPQGRQLFPRMTVENNLRLDLYERFPRLKERRLQLAGSLSGGEQAMVTIARSLLCEPRLLLIDEPSAGLSPAAMDEVLQMLQQLRAEGLTMLMVEQNITFGFRLVDRAAIMQRGRIVYEGAVSELDTAKVASLLGIGRLLGAHLERAVGAQPAGAREPTAKKEERVRPARRRTAAAGKDSNSK